MKLRVVKVLLFLPLSVCSVTAIAQTDKKAVIKNGSSYFKIWQASMQRTLPGVRGSEPFTQYRFLIIWKSKAQPETFFWRGDKTWMTCNVQKAHKTDKGTKGTTLTYTTEMIKAGSVKKGDTLEIAPMKGGKYAIPAEIAQTAINTLFFKATKTNWLKYPVKNIERKPDIIMP